MTTATVVVGPGLGVFSLVPVTASTAPEQPLLPSSAMSFGELVTAPEVWPFSLALLLFFVLSLLEIVLVFTGLGAEFGLEVDVDLPDVTASGRFLDWLGLGKVPYLVSVAAFLLCFGGLGLAVQDVQLELLGTALPWPPVAIGCAAASLPVVRVLNRLLGRVWPKDESSAVTADSLIGHEAVVVMGQLSAASPAQIKVRDEHGTMHYALAVADVAGETYEPGVPLLIVGRRDAIYTVIRHPNPTEPPQS